MRAHSQAQDTYRHKRRTNKEPNTATEPNTPTKNQTQAQRTKCTNREPNPPTKNQTQAQRTKCTNREPNTTTKNQIQPQNQIRHQQRTKHRHKEPNAPTENQTQQQRTRYSHRTKYVHQQRTKHTNKNHTQQQKTTHSNVIDKYYVDLQALCSAQRHSNAHTDITMSQQIQQYTGRYGETSKDTSEMQPHPLTGHHFFAPLMSFALTCVHLNPLK
jgi:hypothetical protein